jgi:hypothetical protein
MRYPSSWSALALASFWGCGDHTAPELTQPGYVLSVSVPGLTDTTFRGDSVYWRFLTGPSPTGGPDRRQLDLKLIVLDPPAPLASPLVLLMQWYQVDAPLPAARTYALDPNPPTAVTFQISSNLGAWSASRGKVTLSEVTDSSLKGSVTATLVAGLSTRQQVAQCDRRGQLFGATRGRSLRTSAAPGPRPTRASCLPTYPPTRLPAYPGRQRNLILVLRQPPLEGLQLGIQ